MSTPLWKLSAIETARRIRDREVSAREVVQSHVERLRAINPWLNAISCDLSEQALIDADEADKSLATRGFEPAALHGVPLTIKHNVDYAGQANPNGVVALKGLIASEDAPVVARLRQAGAICLGLSNVPEFSLRVVTDNPLFGLTLNPWDGAITCGGSSGGAGAALAAGIGALAHGSDIGGSLRIPAHCNGVATLKPTLGRVPAFNPSASRERSLMAQLMAVHGPMARHVGDLRLGLQVMSGRDARDPWYVPAPLHGPALPRRAALARVPADMHTDPDVMALVGSAARHLSAAGYEIEEVELPDLDGTWDDWQALLIADIRALDESAIRTLGSAEVVQVLEISFARARALDLPAYIALASDRARRLREWMRLLEQFPVIIAPVSTAATPGPREDLLRAAQIFRDELRFCGPVNHLGLPSAVVPVGLTPAGHPVGVQLIASRYREDIALAAAQAVEAGAGILAPLLWSRLASHPSSHPSPRSAA